MIDETPKDQATGGKPVVAHPGFVSIDDLLRYIDPAPDDETERFVAAIYADRRAAAGNSSS